MFDKIKAKKAAKKQKKNRKAEKFLSLTANGVDAPVINFELTKSADDEPLILITTKGEMEQLHYSEIDFELKTDKKMVRVKGAFKNASNLQKDFKRYVFLIEDYQQYYI